MGKRVQSNRIKYIGEEGCTVIGLRSSTLEEGCRAMGSSTLGKRGAEQ